MSDTPSMNPEELKACCSNLYEHPLVQQLIGDSFHPGGTALTEQLGRMLELNEDSRVLDVASGRGTSAIHLAKAFGCTVTGVDLSETNARRANEEAVKHGVGHLVSFTKGDAEQLNLKDAIFDAVICECALCTFPNKPLALSEFYRVLKPGGHVGISDLTRSGPLSEDLQGLLSWVACIADAHSAGEYLQLLANAGFCNDCGYTAVNEVLNEMVGTIQMNLVGAKIMKGLGKLELPESVDLDEAVRVAKSARVAIESKQLGYGVFIGIKPLVG